MEIESGLASKFVTGIEVVSRGALIGYVTTGLISALKGDYSGEGYGSSHGTFEAQNSS
jgi:hypothetical protein